MVLVKIDLDENARRVTTHIIDLIKEAVETNEYELDEKTNVSLVEEAVYVFGSRKHINYISSDAFKEDISVPLDDVDAVKLVNALCNLK